MYYTVHLFNVFEKSYEIFRTRNLDLAQEMALMYQENDPEGYAIYITNDKGELIQCL